MFINFNHVFNYLLFSVVNAVFTLIMSSFLRIIYKGYDALGSMLISLTVRNQKEKIPVPPIGDRKVLLLSASDMAHMVIKLPYKKHYTSQA